MKTPAPFQPIFLFIEDSYLLSYSQGFSYGSRCRGCYRSSTIPLAPQGTMFWFDCSTPAWTEIGTSAAKKLPRRTTVVILKKHLVRVKTGIYKTKKYTKKQNAKCKMHTVRNKIRCTVLVHRQWSGMACMHAYIIYIYIYIYYYYKVEKGSTLTGNGNSLHNEGHCSLVGISHHSRHHPDHCRRI